MTPDAQFAHPRLAAVYDALDPDRSDLDAYVAMTHEIGARSVLDVGCGTGTLACRLVADGCEVVGIDPAAASLAIARSKPEADRVRWIEGEVHALPGEVAVDLAVMTGNVAQVFLDDTAWAAALDRLRAALRPGGHLVFEARRPDARAWDDWTPEATRAEAELPGIGSVTSEIEVLEVRLPVVRFRTTFRFADDGTVLTSESSLRFRDRTELERSLVAAGYTVSEVRDAPDRPGRELVVIAIAP